jgi:hypothetical protein
MQHFVQSQQRNTVDCITTAYSACCYIWPANSGAPRAIKQQTGMVVQKFSRMALEQVPKSGEKQL